MKTIYKSSLFAIAITFLSCAVCSCSSSKSTLSAAQREAINKAITQQDYTIQLNVMEPLVTNAVAQVTNQLFLRTGNTSNRVDISSQGYTLKIKNDSIFTNLPYVGERQMGGGYNNSNSGINLKDVYTNYELTQEANVSNITLYAKNTTESYNIRIAVSDTGYSRVQIFSSQRNTISYTGFLKVNAVED